MAIQTELTTLQGEDRECYVRLIDVHAHNHGAPSTALFRAFLSQEAFEAGSHYVAEFEIDFDADVSEPLWPQAYVALADQREFPAAEV